MPSPTAHPFNNFPLAKSLTDEVKLASQNLGIGTADILSQVSDTTAELLLWWFQADNMDLRPYNFHDGQRQAILNTIYAHEVLQCDNLHALYKKLNHELLIRNTRANEELQESKNQHRKYCVKMATGTGKTWVLEALLLWQILNAKQDPDNPLFTRNFLIIAPGLIVYDRLLGAFLGKENAGVRDFDSSDFKQFGDLLIPDNHREEVFTFLQNSVCKKEDIATKTTGSGFIGITNWHAIKEIKDDEEDEEEDYELIVPAKNIDPKAVINDILPIMPGTAGGNDLNQLNSKFERGNTITYLKNLPSLMVFNDEAHHVHSGKDKEEMQWQKSLTAIAANKIKRFSQIDFSATPYRQTNKGPLHFPHIIMNLDLNKAMREGFVKSLVLDKREEVGAIPNDELEFRADRDADGNIALSEGQRIMLSAGLTKLEKLAERFKTLDTNRHPKMMVVCEDTKVTPIVEEFLKEKGYDDDEILRIDTNSKGEVSQKEWNGIREKLFDMDNHRTPRIIISVLMLREGFDVNNVCVIVPLRASKSRTLLEQTIGRGLRLMWREGEYRDTKKENRTLINDGKAPNSLIDVLNIVEHPAFADFYDELRENGLIADIDGVDPPPINDLISVGLREGYEEYDFAIPRIIRERQEELQQKPINISKLPSLEDFTFQQLKDSVGKGDKFHSEDVQTKTRFGDYRVEGGIMTATGYNTYLARLTKRISEVPYPELTASGKVYSQKSKFPYLQIEQPKLMGLLDSYIKTQLFGKAFDPQQDENWRILLLEIVSQHIIKTWYQQLLDAENTEITAEAEVKHYYLSEEADKFNTRESRSVKVKKCIYERLDYPSQSGGLEKAFIETCNDDSSVEAFCKIRERNHLCMRLRYLKDNGMMAHYYPDFLVRTKDHIYLVETKAQNQTKNPDVKRKEITAVEWCESINELNKDKRADCLWAYVLLGEDVFYRRRDGGQSIEDILAFAKVRKRKKDMFKE